jgi:hypothetical protein
MQLSPVISSLLNPYTLQILRFPQWCFCGIGSSGIPRGKDPTNMVHSNTLGNTFSLCAAETKSLDYKQEHNRFLTEYQEFPNIMNS